MRYRILNFFALILFPFFLLAQTPLGAGKVSGSSMGCGCGSKGGQQLADIGAATEVAGATGEGISEPSEAPVSTSPAESSAGSSPTTTPSALDLRHSDGCEFDIGTLTETPAGFAGVRSRMNTNGVESAACPICPAWGLCLQVARSPAQLYSLQLIKDDCAGSLAYLEAPRDPVTGCPSGATFVMQDTTRRTKEQCLKTDDEIKNQLLPILRAYLSQVGLSLTEEQWNQLTASGDLTGVRTGDATLGTTGAVEAPETVMLSQPPTDPSMTVEGTATAVPIKRIETSANFGEKLRLLFQDADALKAIKVIGTSTMIAAQIPDLLEVQLKKCILKDLGGSCYTSDDIKHCLNTKFSEATRATTIKDLSTVTTTLTPPTEPSQPVAAPAETVTK